VADPAGYAPTADPEQHEYELYLAVEDAATILQSDADGPGSTLDPVPLDPATKGKHDSSAPRRAEWWSTSHGRLRYSGTSNLLKQAVESYQAGRLDEAEGLCKALLRADANHVRALHLLGVVQSRLGRSNEALASYDRALAIKPDFAEVLTNRGVALWDLKRFEDALASYDSALAIKPDYAEALNNRGTTLQELKRFEDALASYDRALAIKSDFAEALNGRGITLQGLKRFEEALASYDRALAIKPDFAWALNNRGTTLRELKRFEDALASYDKALAIKPDYAEALNSRGVTLQDLKRFEDALASYDKALAINPDFANALYNRGITLRDLKRFEDALACYDKALAIKPDHLYAFGAIADSSLKICDWRRTAELDGKIRAHVAERTSIITPFTLLGYCSDASLQLKCARSWIENQIPVLPQPLWNGTVYQHDLIRIAYLSADLRRHAMAYLMAKLFELHDRTRFEVLGVSFGEDDKSDMRSRLVKSFDQFHDIRLKTDRDVARLLNELQVDIAVDLMGYTQDSRSDILAHRPAPIQINYLGYPGTMGASFIDYVIADNIVLPFDQQRFYTEKIVQLPECYQVNDSQRKIADRTPTRREAGLPDEGFVFCCFNNHYKIMAPMFDVWMRLLQAVRGSVLWLLGDNASAQTNLCKEAVARGIDPARLVFAGRLPLEDHLARYRLADMFVDTLPYNAHTTASEALWTGLPLVTCRGESFPGRVAASLLNAVGLPELVTHSLEEYEALALKLATDASLLQSIRRKLEQNRLGYPLFDTDRLRRHIEAAYLTAWEIWQRGESPRSFKVEAAL
jgi:predicted O-linked N-acetylglucosamine transferase (SPINDLY family)